MRPTPGVAILGASVLLLAGGGCNKTITSAEFVGKYTANIEVPNPEQSRLPVRSYLGVRGRRTRYHYLRDSIPPGQGGGLLGKVVNWRCPVAEMPADFPEGVAPGDVVRDGRKGSIYEYMIQAYRPAERGSTRPSTRPAGAASRPAKP